jgi:hypothetical protein
MLEILRGQEQRMQQLELSQRGFFLPPQAGGAVGGYLPVGPQYFTTVGSARIPLEAIEGETTVFSLPPLPLRSRRRILKQAEETPIEKEENDSTKSKE